MASLEYMSWVQLYIVLKSRQRKIFISCKSGSDEVVSHIFDSPADLVYYLEINTKIYVSQPFNNCLKVAISHTGEARAPVRKLCYTRINLTVQYLLVSSKKILLLLYRRLKILLAALQ